MPEYLPGNSKLHPLHLVLLGGKVPSLHILQYSWLVFYHSHVVSSNPFSDESKDEDEDAVSGPVFCAWNLTVPATTLTRSQFTSDPNSLTLVGNKTAEGILLLNQKPICDDGWDIEAAHVACRQLGFSRAFQATQTNQANTDEFSLDEVKCRGNESSLLECGHLVQRKENCNSGEAAGVVCDARSEAELRVLIERRTDECFAKNVLFGPEVTSDIWVLPTLLDCQEMCGNTEGCNTFSYDTSSMECRLHSVGEVEETGYPQPSTTTPLPYRAIRVGDHVRVCPNIQSPKHGWGSGVSHGSIGTVREVQERRGRPGEEELRVDFPGKSRWYGDRSEMEVVGINGEGRFKGSRCTGGYTPQTGGSSDSRSGNE